MDDLGSSLGAFEKQDIKTEPMTLDQIDEMKKRSGDYESLFSRKAMKFRSMGLADKQLSETDYRELIHQEYTFLKRPVFLVNEKIFIGNSAKIIDQLKGELK
jgi:arsenate reductase